MYLMHSPHHLSTTMHARLLLFTIFIFIFTKAQDDNYNNVNCGTDTFNRMIFELGIKLECPAKLKELNICCDQHRLCYWKTKVKGKKICDDEFCHCSGVVLTKEGNCHKHRHNFCSLLRMDTKTTRTASDPYPTRSHKSSERSSDEFVRRIVRDADPFSEIVIYCIGTLWVLLFTILLWYAIKAPTIRIPIPNQGLKREEPPPAPKRIPSWITFIFTEDTKCHKFADLKSGGLASGLQEVIYCTTGAPLEQEVNPIHRIYTDMAPMNRIVLENNRATPNILRDALSYAEASLECDEDSGRSDDWINDALYSIEEKIAVSASGATEWTELLKGGPKNNYNLVNDIGQLALNCTKDFEPPSIEAHLEKFDACFIDAQNSYLRSWHYTDKYWITDFTACAMSVGTTAQFRDNGNKRTTTTFGDTRNMVTYCSDFFNEYGPLGTSFSVFQRRKTGVREFYAFASGGGGYRIMEGLARISLIYRLKNDEDPKLLKLARHLLADEGPYRFYDPYNDRVVVDDLRKYINWTYAPDETLLSSLPIKERKLHQRSILIFQSTDTNRDLQVLVDGCYYKCENDRT